MYVDRSFLLYIRNHNIYILSCELKSLK